jgi:hypothetical protein
MNNDYRNELKYITTNIDVAILKGRLDSILTKDYHAKKGSYKVRSLYFDDIHLTSYHQVLDSLNERWKWRIRLYDYDDSYICLEKKTKVNGIVHKKTIELTKQEVIDILHNKNIRIDNKNNKLINEFYLNILTKGLKPIIIIDYDRIPYVYKKGNIRITIDHNLSASDKIYEIFNKEINMIPIIELDNSILEVKYNYILPDYIKQKLNLNHLERTTYSKYLKGMLVLNRKY